MQLLKAFANSKPKFIYHCAAFYEIDFVLLASY